MSSISASRGTADLVRSVRTAIRAGRYPAGRYLPSVRELAGEHGVSHETMRRGLLSLAREGILEARPRQGFMVTESVGEGVVLGPVAYVTKHTQDLSSAQPVNWVLDRALQTGAGRRGWNTLSAHTSGVHPDRFRDQLAASRVWGIVLDTLNEELIGQVRATNLPVVMINSWVEGGAFDAVLQDNFLGGSQAARHLLETGARRVAWIGPVGQYAHSRERFAGAVAGLAAGGLYFDPDCIVDTGFGEMDAAVEKRLKALFKRKHGPEAALLFWRSVTPATLRIAKGCGLKIGRDLKVVGWTSEELFESAYAALYAGVPTPPAITWKASSMIDAALNRLEARRKGERGEAVRVLVPTRLRMANQEPRMKNEG